jgi:hypothetical protein
MLLKPPETVCPKTESWVGGSLDALIGSWGACAKLHLLESVTGRLPKWGTQVRIGWDGYALHCLFVCQDPHPWATKTTHDDALWEEEVVEVFLDPFGDSLSYFEIGLNPLNTSTDLFVRRIRTGLRKDFRWNCADLETATGTLPYGWVAAFKIPFKSLGDCHPSRSGLWRVNFTRIERPVRQPRELTAWAPTFSGSFHAPERFGVLRFSNDSAG